jgi:hypothetical protein
MDSNTHSDPSSELPEPTERSVGLAGLPGVLDELAAEDLDRLSDSALAKAILALRGWLDGLEGQWLRRLAAADARGAAGADRGRPAPSTASWSRNRLRLGAATGAVRTARALFRALGSDRSGVDRWGDLPGSCPGPGPRHPGSCRPRHGGRRNRCCWRRQLGWTRPSWARRSGICARSLIPTGPTPPPPPPRTPGAVAVADLGQHGGRGWAVGGRGRPAAPSGPGAAGPPAQRRRPPQGWAADR